LQEDLYIDPDDLDMVIAMRVAERTGRSLEQPERNPHYDKIVTVGDLVNFFNNQPHSVPAPQAAS
jgi:Mn-dependent DtxR family transcriptional regulator